MNVTVIGAGYVGLVTASCLAETGNNVVCVDKDPGKIESLRGGKAPISEPYLDEIICEGAGSGRLLFTTDIAVGVARGGICFIAVDTPSLGDGNADISKVITVAEQLGASIEEDIVVVVKSTVPVGTTSKVGNIIHDVLKKRGKEKYLISVAFNPEFLVQGDAVACFKKPDRVIVGVAQDAAANILGELYKPFMLKKDRFIKMDITSAELTKYAANAMLATRISFMNSLSRLCEKIGANIDMIRCGIGSDRRIGNDFLFPSLGYGGSCFPKDLKAIAHLSREHGETLDIVEAVERVNKSQIQWFYEKIKRHFDRKGGLRGKKIAIWGLSFKANTDDIRESRAVILIKSFMDEGSFVKVYDPKAMVHIRKLFGDSISFCNDIYECVGSADALVVCNEWQEFRSPDWNKIRLSMNDPTVFDGKNLYSSLEQHGIQKIGIGGK